MRDAVTITPGEAKGQSGHPVRPVMVLGKRMKHVRLKKDLKGHQTTPGFNRFWWLKSRKMELSFISHIGSMILVLYKYYIILTPAATLYTDRCYYISIVQIRTLRHRKI